ncbi:MAG TPA: response regulator [Phycisphaerae bacterium]|jgi:CheY-like chemotaxis protein|nr:response regulator [Phycisphaerae bacterium]HOB76314.1 response regulator [Phycisphaerae bacterium]HOJ55479.1 response regulator [Phycisphaerae bacterium]HOL25988.1 response regulator [Phycisphaerae bacterium]HPP22714.1 response regulator [Phycisphaerae bacterium]
MARVLIVEDETSQRYLISNLLTCHGHEAVATCGPLDAAQAIEWFRPDVVVADYHAGIDQTGLEAAETLRGVLPNVRLVFVTQESKEILEEDARHLKPFRVVNQPWHCQDLMGAVQAELD